MKDAKPRLNLSKMHIQIGSKSFLKYTAVQQALSTMGVKPKSILCAEVSSGQSAQPVGLQATISGAQTRAENAHTQDPASLSIGIESGLIYVNSIICPVIFDVAAVVIIALNETCVEVLSQGFQIPQEYVQKAEERGFITTTAGDIIAEKLGGRAEDPHLTLSGGRISRVKLIEQAVISALLQI